MTLLSSRRLLPALLGASALGLAVQSAPASAEPASVTLPTIVIYANQTPTDAARVGSAVTVVSDSQISETGAKTVSDVLRTVPGVVVGQTGSRGSLTQLRIRGAEANHLLVVIDGVPVNGFSDGGFDFADLPVDDIERIEIIRGPQSGLYGANAHAGVVSIITRSAKGVLTPEIEARTEIGSRNTQSGSVAMRAAFGPAYGSIAVSQYRTDGYNIAHNGSEEDASRAFSVNAKGGIDLTENLNVEGMLRYSHRRAETDPQDTSSDFFTGIASPTYGEVLDIEHDNTDETTFSGRVSATFRMFDDHWIHQASVARYENDTDSESTGFSYSSFLNTLFAFPSEYHTEGERYVASYKNTFLFDTPSLLGAHHSVTTGVDSQQERFRDAFGPKSGVWNNFSSRGRTGFFAEYALDLDTGTSATGSVRYDDNNAYADSTTWRATFSQRFAATGTRLHASAGTGVTDPTFIEVFGYPPFGFVGNPNLKPEKSLGWDVGVEQSLLDGRIVADVTYFSSRFKDKITTVYAPVYTTVNTPGTATRQGFEAAITVMPLDWLTVTGTYTYTIAENAAGLAEARVPQNAASLTAVARFLEDKAEVHAGVRYNGDMIDGFPAGAQIASYTVVNAGASYKVDDRLTVFARAENLFDEKYEESYSYRAPGFEAYAGVKVALQAK
ncbi:MAG: TonB-dependent receptor [Hyphomicrobiales bacterium]